MDKISLLDPDRLDFPSVDQALEDPDGLGLLAVGGDLSPQRLERAYRSGIFPWYAENDPICWWSPDPRAVLMPGDLKISRSLRKLLRRRDYEIRSDTAFEEVIHACASSRSASETRISKEMSLAYTELYRMGHAHSVEVWIDDRLVGGLYGVSVGNIFSGESMFHRDKNTSKIAYVYMAEVLFANRYRLVDNQILNPHLRSLGVKTIPRCDYIQLLQNSTTDLDWPTEWDVELKLLSDSH